jgi:hypothetical protein
MPAGTPIQVRLPDEELDALDKYRREHQNPPSRAQAIRVLARIVLSGATSFGTRPSPANRAGPVR